MHSSTGRSGDRRSRLLLAILTIAFVTAAVLISAAPSLAEDGVTDEVAAEEEFDRHRYGIMFGGGYGRISIGEEGVFGETSSTPDDYTMGMAFAFEYAYRIDTQISVDGFLTTWMGTLSGDLGNEDWNVAVIGGGFRWRPTGGGFYLRGGLGASFVSANLVDPQSDDYEPDYMDVGLGVVGSLGYDVRVARTFAAGPRVEVIALDVGDGVTAMVTSLFFTFTF